MNSYYVFSSQIKKGPKAATDLTELRIQATLSALTLKKLNRLDKGPFNYDVCIILTLLVCNFTQPPILSFGSTPCKRQMRIFSP